MGLFSTSKKVIVSSVVYNLAGAPEERPDFLKTTVTSGILGPGSMRRSMGRHIVDSMFNGPALEQRSFHRWGRTHFPIGAPDAEVVKGISTQNFDFTPYITVPEGSSAEVLSSSIGAGDFFYWAERHILENNPDAYDTSWTADYDGTNQTIIIQYADGSSEVIPGNDVDKNKHYVYVRYILVTPQPDDPIFGPQPDLREPHIFIYQKGTGTPELDALVVVENTLLEFYPFIPMRLNNTSVRAEEYTTNQPIFDDCKKAFRKASGGKNINKLLDNIEDNENLDDIDYCFLTYGVPLNTQDNNARRYIYEFFRTLLPFQDWSVGEYNEWVARVEADPDRVAEDPPVSTLRLRSSETVTRAYDMRIHWVLIDENVSTGLGKPDATTGEIWFVSEPGIIYRKVIHGEEFEGHALPGMSIYYQEGDNSYRKLTIWGLVHQNFVYAGKSVDITCSQALADTDDSGFIVPMHYPTVQQMPLTQATQMSVSNALLVFNCYEVKKVRWYQTGFFKILVVIAAIAISVVTAGMGAPGSLAAAGGVLGTNLAVGTALGLTGLAAAIAGAVANSLAAMLLTMALTKASTLLLGEEIGAIIGVIASFVALQAVSSYQLTGDLALNWGQMMTAENLLKITQSVGRAFTGYAQAEIADMQEELQSLATKYEGRLDEIEKLTAELLGYSGAMLDPLMFLETQDTSHTRVESSGSFLQRTLLTGSDIAEVSLGMIDDFAELSLELPDYTT